MAKKKSKAASQEYLEDLHRVFSEMLLKDLTKARTVGEDGKETIPTALYNVIRQFLRDNKIEKVITDTQGDSLGLLSTHFAGVGPGEELDDDTEAFGEA
jgi:hypothetical protein